MTSAVLGAAALLAVVGFLLVRGLEHRLAALADRLHRLEEGQRDLPRQVAEEGAMQARSLSDVRDRLAGLEAQTRQLDALNAAVEDVRQVLAVPKLRGALGELWLEELLGDVLPKAHWDRQYAFPSGERVDAVIRLGDGLVPVDAKFPLEACRRMMAATGEERVREARAFARSLRERVDEIANRYIRPEQGTYPFALMYVPAEGVYWEAVQLEGEVLTYARSRNVVLVSPNTFYAYLQAIAHGLRGLAIEARARELVDGLAGLRQELVRFDETAELARRHLQHAQRQFEELARLGQLLGDRVARFADRAPPAS